MTYTYKTALNKIININIILIFLSFMLFLIYGFINSDPLFYILLLTIPLITILLVFISKGELRYQNDKGKNYQEVYGLIFIPTFFTYVIAIKRVRIINMDGSLWVILIIGAFFLTTTMVFAAKKNEFKTIKKESYFFIIFSFIIFMTYTYSFVGFFNSYLDKSKQVTYSTKIIDKEQRSGRCTNCYYITINDLNLPYKFDEIFVNKDDFNKAYYGVPINLQIYKGFFNIPWYTYDLNKPVKHNDELDVNNWIDYNNKELGIGFKHPKTIDGNEIVFFQVGKVLFATTSNNPLYLQKNKLLYLKNSDPIDIIKKSNHITGYNESLFGPPGSWAIYVEKLNSKEDLNKITKKMFADSTRGGCEVLSLEPSNIKDVFNVKIGATNNKPDQEFGEGDCFTNWGVGFKYSKIYNKAAIWYLGQDYQFSTYNCDSPETYCGADDKMEDSFYFTN